MVAKVSVVLVVVVMVMAVSGANMGMRGQEQWQGDQGRNSRQAPGQMQYSQEQDNGGRNAKQYNADSGKYRTNLYTDDDVYGYDATYPGGEALFVSYKNSEARARRGPEFARASKYSRSNEDSMGSRGQGNYMGSRTMGGRDQRMASREMW